MAKLVDQEQVIEYFKGSVDLSSQLIDEVLEMIYRRYPVSFASFVRRRTIVRKVRKK